MLGYIIYAVGVIISYPILRYITKQSQDGWYSVADRNSNIIFSLFSLVTIFAVVIVFGLRYLLDPPKKNKDKRANW